MYMCNIVDATRVSGILNLYHSLAKFCFSLVKIIILNMWNV